ncbi:MAG TPA: FecR domain-containing protein [Polyangiaceae bacterium]|nr:FecR domain-containing protein [Polyangiaceae bacterium]
MSQGDELRPLRGVTSVEPSEEVARRRPALVSAIEREMAAAHQRAGERARFRRRASLAGKWLGGCVAAAAGVLLAYGVFRGGPSFQAGQAHSNAQSAAPGSAARLLAPNGAQQARVTPSTQLGAGSTISTEAGSGARLALGERVSVEVGESTRLELEELGAERHVVRLPVGAIDVEVASGSGSPRHFAVSTPDSLVEVRGTGFRVEVRHTEQGAPYSVVSVRHGRVSVTHRGQEHLLGAGETFRTVPRPGSSVGGAALGAPAVGGPGIGRLGSSSAAASPAGSAANGSAASTAGPGVSGAGESTSEALPARVVSSLAQENALFERALAARDAGRGAEAIRVLEELLQRYPDSPLRAGANSELGRLRGTSAAQPIAPR